MLNFRSFFLVMLTITLMVFFTSTTIVGEKEELSEIEVNFNNDQGTVKALNFNFTTDYSEHLYGDYFTGEEIVLEATDYGDYEFVEWVRHTDAGTEQLGTDLQLELTLEDSYYDIEPIFEYVDPDYIPEDAIEIRAYDGHLITDNEQIGTAYYKNEEENIFSVEPVIGYKFIGWTDANGDTVSESKEIDVDEIEYEERLSARFKQVDENVSDIYDRDNNPVFMNGVGFFETIQEAVDNARYGSEIIIAEGTYEETISIDQEGIEIKSVPGEDVILDGTNMEHGTPAITIENEGEIDLRIQGLTLLNFTEGVRASEGQRTDHVSLSVMNYKLDEDFQGEFNTFIDLTGNHLSLVSSDYDGLSKDLDHQAISVVSDRVRVSSNSFINFDTTVQIDPLGEIPTDVGVLFNDFENSNLGVDLNIDNPNSHNNLGAVNHNNFIGLDTAMQVMTANPTSFTVWFNEFINNGNAFLLNEVYESVRGINHSITINQFVDNDVAINYDGEEEIYAEINYWGSADGPVYEGSNSISSNIEVERYYLNSDFTESNAIETRFETENGRVFVEDDYEFSELSYSGVNYFNLYTYEEKSITFTAIPDEGYTFVGWKDEDGELIDGGDEQEITLDADQDADYFVVFEEIEEQLLDSPAEEKVEEAIESGVLNLDFSEDENLSQAVSVTQQFGREVIDRLSESNAMIDIGREDIGMSIPSQVFDGDGEGESVSANFTKVESEVPNRDEAASEIYSFELTGRDGEPISEFENTPITLRYQVKDSFDGNHDDLRVMYYDPELEDWTLIGGEYKDGYVEAEVRHFSTFGVFEYAEAAEDDDSSNDEATEEEQQSSEGNGTEEGSQEEDEESSEQSGTEEEATSEEGQESSGETGTEEESSEDEQYTSEETSSTEEEQEESTEEEASDEEEEEQLVQTSNGTFLYGLIGAGLLLVGIGLLYYNRRRNALAA
ncbi:hypothetical protein J2R98_002220 [Alkalibacillus filiformis]|uniref:Bacterial repeat domain-containing protein n=1 Tax=Alkalibacillus filiformis TaxID=200990 RepID=A0ABU0DVS2_9BACI|nr:hypothetical protein [Alkalibacillus filiformis]MDQ0352376.1 hypothetical protein [Alkalibacillus filiformis]